MQFNKEQPEEDKVFLGGKINEPGCHICTIDRAWDHVADTGSIGIKFEFTSSKGQAYSTYINTVKKDGSQNDIGVDTIQKTVMPLLRLNTLKEKPNDPQVFYDFNSQTDITRRVTSYPQLANKRIGLLLKIGEYYNGKPRLEIDRWFDADTQKTAHELVSNLPAEHIANRLEWVLAQSEEAEHVERKAETNGKTATHMPSQSQSSFDDDFDDTEIPF